MPPPMMATSKRCPDKAPISRRISAALQDRVGALEFALIGGQRVFPLRLVARGGTDSRAQRRLAQQAFETPGHGLGLRRHEERAGIIQRLGVRAYAGGE